MGFISTIKTGLTITKRSLVILRDNPKLLVFPVLSGLSLLVFFVGGVIGLSVFAVLSGVGEQILEGYWWLGTVAIGYFVAAVLTSFFNAGLVHETTQVLQGKQPSIRSGFAAAWRVRRKILVWGLISSVFGVAIEILESSDSRIAWFVSTLLQASWAVLTFFIVPVMLFTDADVAGMFEESGRTFRDVWGESLTASAGIDLLSLFGFILIIVAMIGLFSLGGPAIFFGIVFLLALSALFALAVIRSGAHAVSKAALYEYAQTETVPGVLDGIDIQGLASGQAEQRPRRSWEESDEA